VGEYSVAVDNHDAKYQAEGVTLEDVVILGEKVAQSSPRIRAGKGAVVSVR
jgi:hypothetical protein